MKDSTYFELKPFKATSQTSAIALGGQISYAAGQLSITYILSSNLAGDLENVDIAPSKIEGDRTDRLWEQTCFEFFLRLANPDSSNYWEFNLSPSGDWNVFALAGYRQGLREESAIAHLSIQTQRSPTQLRLALSVDITPLIGQFTISSAPQDIELGVSAVLILGGQESFWAIAYPSQKPDFHHPDSFTLCLAK